LQLQSRRGSGIKKIMVTLGKKAIAHHEAGHAVIARILDVGVTRATIVASDSGKGSADVVARHAFPITAGKDTMTRITALETDAKVCFGGPEAQNRYRPLTDGQTRRAWESLWADDCEEIWTRIGMAIKLKHGEEPTGRFELDAAEVAEGNVLFERLLRETEILVEQYWPAIQRVATALLNHRSLTQDEIDALIAVR
jgi:hypothetical protein